VSESERSSTEEGAVGLNRLAPGPVPYFPVPTDGLFCQAGRRIIAAPSPSFSSVRVLLVGK